MNTPPSDETLPPPPVGDGKPNISRRALLVAAGAASLGLGVGLSIWRRASAPVRAATAEPIEGFWSMQWGGPDGQPVRMQAFEGRPLLINFWATWCPPCVDELPLINAFFNQNKTNGMQVLGLAVDKATAVQAFLAQNPLSFPVAVVGLGGGDLGRLFGNLSGGLPFSVLVGAQGQVLQRKMGRLSADDLSAWAALK